MGSYASRSNTLYSQHCLSFVVIMVSELILVIWNGNLQLQC